MLWCEDLPIELLSKCIYYVQADTMLDWYVVSLRWYRGLILGCVECRHRVSNWMSSYFSSRRLLLWGCLWMSLAGTVSPVGELWHKTWWWPYTAETRYFDLTLKNIHFYVSYELCFWLPSHLSSLHTQQGWHSLKLVKRGYNRLYINYQLDALIIIYS